MMFYNAGEPGTVAEGLVILGSLRRGSALASLARLIGLLSEQLLWIPEMG